MKIIKTEIRKTIHRQRQLLSIAETQQAAASVCQLLQQQSVFIQAQHLAFYLAYNNELSIENLLQIALAENKHCYLPVLDPENINHLLFCRYQTHDSLITNRYGILEPICQPDNYIDPQHLDIVFTPLVAFDENCRRLGMGKGYYDRSFSFLKNNAIKKPVMLGIAYELQKLPVVPCDAWDIPLDAIATEKTIYWNK